MSFDPNIDPDFLAAVDRWKAAREKLFDHEAHCNVCYLADVGNTLVEYMRRYGMAVKAYPACDECAEYTYAEREANRAMWRTWEEVIRKYEAKGTLGRRPQGESREDVS